MDSVYSISKANGCPANLFSPVWQHMAKPTTGMQKTARSEKLIYIMVIQALTCDDEGLGHY